MSEDAAGATEVEFEVVENAAEGRFELLRGGELVGFAIYSEEDGSVVVPHVETIARYRGNGFGARLMEGLLAIIAADGRPIVPLCSFAAGHLRDNPQHRGLLATR